jgi:patatin-like phospholipase/acyl hydrolase
MTTKIGKINKNTGLALKKPKKYFKGLYLPMTISDKRLKEIENISDSAIDTSDIPELDEHFWANAKMVKPITKKAISIRIDEDIRLLAEVRQQKEE